MTISPEQSAGIKESNRRFKLWEIDKGLLCSIMGICLTVEEMKKIAKKTGDPVESTSDFELHEMFVKETSEASEFSRLINKTLNRKFEMSIRLSSRCKTDDELLQFWRKSRQEGRLSGAYWAILTHPNASSSLCREIYGESHMLSYTAITDWNREERKKQELIAKVEIAEKNLAIIQNKLKQHIEQKKQTIKKFEAENQETQRQITLLTAALNRIAQLDAEKTITQLNVKIQELEHKLYEKEQENQQLHNNFTELEHRYNKISSHFLTLHDQFEDVKHENDTLEQLLIALNEKKHAQCSSCENKNKYCPCLNLSGRCVVYVGGQHSLVPFYRQIVEQFGGEFLHHDGGKEENHGALENYLKKADGVVCPINCISHDACLRVKRLCKQWQKPFVPVRTSSLSALARGIEHIAAVMEN